MKTSHLWAGILVGLALVASTWSAVVVSPGPGRVTGSLTNVVLNEFTTNVSAAPIRVQGKMTFTQATTNQTNLTILGDFSLLGGRALTVGQGSDNSLPGGYSLQLAIDPTWTNVVLSYNGNNNYVSLSTSGWNPDAATTGTLPLGGAGAAWGRAWVTGLTNAGTTGLADTLTAVGAFQLPLHAAVSAIWTCTNATTGQGDWKSNVVSAYTLDNVATNGSANSNLTMNADVATRDVYATNNLSITNFAGLVAGSLKPVTWFITPLLVNRALVLPTLGGNQFGVHLYTNANNAIPSALLPTTNYALSITWRGTNGHITVSEWK